MSNRREQMFSANETVNNPRPTDSTSFESIEHFASWLDSELDLLVSKFADFETDKSVRNFLKRS
jgi:hypothetical protein